MPSIALRASDITGPVTQIGDALFGNRGQATIDGRLDGALFNQRSESARLSGAQADTETFYLNNRRGAVDMLRADPRLMDTPEGRAMLQAAIVGSSDNFSSNSQALPGAATFINPDVFTPPELGNIGFANGNISDWGNTPQGFELGEANDLRQASETASMNAAARLGAAEIAAQSAQDVQRLRDGGRVDGPGGQLSVLEANRNGGFVQDRSELAGWENRPPAEQDWLRQRYNQVLAETQNADTAWQIVEAEYQELLDGRPRRMFGLRGPGASAVGELPSLGDMMSGPAQPQMGNPTDSAQPQTGNPELMDPLPPVSPDVAAALGPASEGERAVSPSTGVAFIFRNGAWREEL